LIIFKITAINSIRNITEVNPTFIWLNRAVFDAGLLKQISTTISKSVQQ